MDLFWNWETIEPQRHTKEFNIFFEKISNWKFIFLNRCLVLEKYSGIISDFKILGSFLVENIFEVFIICLTVLCQIFLQFYSGILQSKILSKNIKIYHVTLFIITVDKKIDEMTVWCVENVYFYEILQVMTGRFNDDHEKHD
jgi:hypothetical protein